MTSLARRCAMAAMLLAIAMPLRAEPQRIAVLELASAPKLDGEFDDWGKDGWQRIDIAPTVRPDERAKLGLGADDLNAVGKATVELKAGVHLGTFHLAVRWADDAEDSKGDFWSWNGRRYRRVRRYGDMFAVRLERSGNYDRSMLSGKSYEVDLWQWSAHRSQAAGIAADYRHVITTSLLENAAEYTVDGVGTVFIKKFADEGHNPFKTVRPPRTRQADQIEATTLNGVADGSFADVRAAGRWRDGHWQLELARALDTGHADDVVLPAGGSIVGQIAVFNHAEDENKSVSEPLRFDFSAIRR
ncbi:MAG: hypothetical protein KDH15_14630 [Rhodocyclaceae bacterium]|nr:hypothetical protein [Rhodocyclaceae bacterium]